MMRALFRAIGSAALVLLVALRAPAQEAASSRTLVIEAIAVHPPGGLEEDVVRRVLPLQVGDPIDADRASAARLALLNCGAFRHVDTFTSPGTARGAVVLEVEAELDRAAKLETGFGDDARTGWYFNVLSVRWDNPYRSGGSLRAGARLGRRRTEGFLETECPARAHDLAILVQGTAGDERRPTGFDNAKISRWQARIGLRWQNTPAWSTTFWTGLSHARSDFPGLQLNQRYRDLSIESVLDRRNLQTPWRRGHWLAARLNGSDAEGFGPFLRANLEARTAVPLPAGGAMAFRARGEFSTHDTPYFLRSVVGGTGSIRGFRDGDLSGPLGSSSAWLVTTELRIPVFGDDPDHPRTMGILFVDVGEYWNSNGSPMTTAVGAGYGLRLHVPWVHVVGLDVGIPLRPALHLRDRFTLDGSLGFEF